MLYGVSCPGARALKRFLSSLLHGTAPGDKNRLTGFLFPVSVPLTADQREKLVKQREQYEKVAENLEDQLLKLKVFSTFDFPSWLFCLVSFSTSFGSDLKLSTFIRKISSYSNCIMQSLFRIRSIFSRFFHTGENWV
jgi:hypothetical protein